MSKLRPHLFWLALITVIAIFLTRNIWSTKAWIETHDGLFHVIRQEEFTAMFRLGHFPVRWAGTLDHGFGLPAFNYVYPGPYILGLPLTLLGLSAKLTIKLITLFLYLFGALGIYAIFAKRKRDLAAVAACLYLVTPYLLLNIFVRGALGEFAAISLIPWVIWSIEDLRSSKNLRWYHPLPFFCLFLAHNFLSFLFIPIYLVFAHVRGILRPSIFSLLYSLGLSSFFVIPMIFERGYLASVAAGNFTYPYTDHFVYPLQLLFGKWGNGPSLPGTGDGLSFQLGLPHLFVLAVGLFFALRHKLVELRLGLLFVLGAIFLMLPISSVIWEIATPLQTMQFPWRLLSLTTVFIPYIAYFVLEKLQYLRLIIISLLAIGFYFAYHYTIPPYYQNNEQFATQLFIHRDRTTTSSRQELLPKWGAGEEKWKPGEEAILHGDYASLETLYTDSLSTVIKTEVTKPGTTIEIRRNFFPSWQAVDESGNKFPLVPSAQGEIILTPEMGSHTYRVSVGETKLELIANLLSVITLLFLVLRKGNCIK